MKSYRPREGPADIAASIYLPFATMENENERERESEASNESESGSIE